MGDLFDPAPGPARAPGARRARAGRDPRHPQARPRPRAPRAVTDRLRDAGRDRVRRRGAGPARSAPAPGPQQGQCLRGHLGPGAARPDPPRRRTRATAGHSTSPSRRPVAAWSTTCSPVTPGACGTRSRPGRRREARAGATVPEARERGVARHRPRITRHAALPAGGHQPELPRARGAGARALARARRLPRDAAPPRGGAAVRVLRGTADRQRPRPAPITCSRACSRTSSPATRRCAATTCPARPAGTATACRSSWRSSASSASAPSTRSRRTASPSSTSAAASRSSPTSRSGTG